jgi:hypothetical protein
MRRSRLCSTVLLTGVAVVGSAVMPATAWAGKSKASVDRTAPTVSIGSPTAGSTDANPLTVTGASFDNVAVSKVMVAVDSGTSTNASGTSTWSWSAPSLAAGSHTIRATAYDTAGNSASTSMSVTVASASSTLTANGLAATRTDLANPQTSPAMLVGRGRSAEHGGLSVLLYRDGMSWAPWAEFRTSSAMAEVSVPWPSPSNSDWYDTSYALDGNGGLWVLDGSGPVTVRHYQLSGSPLPSSMTLVSTTSYGDTNSRANDLILLASGGIVASFHQQGANGAPQYTTVLYRSPAGAWSTTVLPMYTAVSKWATAQHPGDGSIWLLGDSDAKHSITAIHLTETPSGLSTDWVNESYIDVAQYGDNAPESENPDLQLVADPSSATLVAAYQGNVYQQFGDPTTSGDKGAHVIIARIPASGPLTFSTLDVWAERVSHLALSVQSGAVWVAYHPLDPVTFDFTELRLAKLTASGWVGPVDLGKTRNGVDPVGFSATSPNFFADMADGHLAEFAGS